MLGPIDMLTKDPCAITTDDAPRITPLTFCLGQEDDRQQVTRATVVSLSKDSPFDKIAKRTGVVLRLPVQVDPDSNPAIHIRRGALTLQGTFKEEATRR